MDTFVSKIISESNTSLVFDSEQSYTRICSVERDELENKLKNLYGSQWCEITSSGVNSIYIILFTIFSTNQAKYILTASELFGYTSSTLKMLCSIFNKEILEFDYSDNAKILEYINEHPTNICCMYFESCSNPSNMSINWDILIQVHNLNITTIVDNTWLSPTKFNPFDYNVDIVIDSCTKYLSGGKCIAGCINFKDYSNVAKLCSRNVSLMGIHVSPVHCKIIYRMLDSIDFRIKSATTRAIEIVGFLRTLKNVSSVSYNDLLQPCVTKFTVKTVHKTKQNDIILNQLCEKHNIDYSTSFAKPHDSIDSYPKVYDGFLHVRLAVGYNTDINFLNKLMVFVDELFIASNAKNQNTSSTLSDSV